MTDIVARLRQRAHNGIAPMHEETRLDMLEAAAEIERLRSTLAQPAPAALLVRDIANDLGVSALDVCNALRLMGYGQHSVNMAITADASGALTRHFGAAPQPAA